MKFRIGTKFFASLSLNGMPNDNFIVLLNQVCKKLGWDMKFISQYGVTAFTSFKYGSGNEEITIRREEDEVIIKSESLGSQLHDWGKNEKNVNACKQTFEEMKGELTEEVVATEIEELRSQFPKNEEDDILNPTVYAEIQKKSGLIYMIVPRQGYFVTPILLIINILVFIWMCVSGVSVFMPDAVDIKLWGGNYGPDTLNGEWYRLITCTFVHIGIFHLAMNMYALLYIGIFLEPILGRSRFLSAYFLTGITSSLLSMYMHPDIVSAGASGAIFGMYGVFLALLTTNIIDKASRKAILPSIAIFVGYNLLNGMKEGVDNAGHIGGLIGGLIIGYAFYPSLKSTASNKIKYGIIAVLAALVFVTGIFSFSRTNSPMKKYQEGLITYTQNVTLFSRYEDSALQVYQLSDTASRDSFLYMLKDRGLYCWEKCEQALKANDSLELPPVEVELMSALKHYVALRKDVYNLLYKKSYEQTDIYDAKLEQLNKDVEKAIDDAKQVGKAKPSE